MKGFKPLLLKLDVDFRYGPIEQKNREKSSEMLLVVLRQRDGIARVGTWTGTSKGEVVKEIRAKGTEDRRLLGQLFSIFLML